MSTSPNIVDATFLMVNWLSIDQLTINGVTEANPVLNALGTPGSAFGDFPSIFGGHLPERYDPEADKNGPAVVVRVGGTGTTTGGSAHMEIPLLMPRMQITVWAGKNKFQLARSVYRAIYAWLRRRNNIDLGSDVGYVFSIEEAVQGQDIQDPQTGYATIVSFWHLMLQEELPEF